MNLTRIPYFLKVAELGSISKATSEVFLSQPALTLQIQALEEELGFALFERHNRGLTLTAQGERLYERAKLLREWQRETSALLEAEDRLQGTIKIGTYTTASSYLLAPWLKNFFREHPDISIEYDYGSVEASIQKLKKLDLDCLIMSEVPEIDGLKKIPLAQDQLILVASSKNKEVPARLTPRDLAHYPFLAYPHKFDFCYREVERKLGKYLALAPTPIISESFDTLKQSLLQDIGITFMPRYLIERELKEKVLRPIEVTGLHLPIQFYFVVRAHSKLSGRVAALQKFLLAQI